MSKPKHKFPDKYVAQVFANHCWQHNALLGSLQWSRSRLSCPWTLVPEDQAKIAEAVRLIDEVRNSGKRNDERFKQWEI